MMPVGPLEIQCVYGGGGGGGGMDVTDACLLSPAVTGHPPPQPPNPRPPFHPITPNPLTSFTPGVRRRYNRSNARHAGTNLPLPEVSDICVLCTSCVNFCITPHSPTPLLLLPPQPVRFIFLIFFKPNLLNCEILASNNQFGKREEGEIKFTSASAFGLIIIIEKAGTKIAAK